ncbi:hypothetical protein PCANC_02426 [Puccinia coronata f. sp. avenae]|uniref:Small-subunit processome Utp12 domain-containing protein n=1 Tax=Puccinia coronata f. sp. avenae TaxID=200324 RepID=A0A2N5W4W5_9BASI|nr:hypothetical protein PCANC_04388 [Puccinia coronata f. sp. avenae]PLW57281.1 hypothetical protein PCANC_02426 [Puccinia coronata f. sp. avenae]
MDESEEEQQEIGNKMLAAKCTHSLSGSLNDTSSMHPTSIVSIASFAQTLTQALKSTDTKLLETCFLQQHKNNKNLISNTIQRLPKKLLHTLIEQIIICLNRKKRGHGDGVTAATIPTLVTQLTTLHASLQKRLNLHTKLLSLNGRLELVLNQIELNRVSNGSGESAGLKTLKAIDNAKKKKAASGAQQQEPYRYVEGESSASEQEEAENSDDDSDDSSSSNSNSDQSEEDGEGESDQVGKTDSEEEGSVEDVVLGSGSDEEDSEGSDNEEEGGTTSRIKKLTNGMNDLLDLEAEESGAEDGSGDDEDEDEDDEEEEDDDSLEGFIDDESEAISDEDDSAEE